MKCSELERAKGRRLGVGAVGNLSLCAAAGRKHVRGRLAQQQAVEGLRVARAKVGRAAALVSRSRLLGVRKQNKRVRCQRRSGEERARLWDQLDTDDEQQRRTGRGPEGSSLGDGRWLRHCRGRCEGHGRPLVRMGKSSNQPSAPPPLVSLTPGACPWPFTASGSSGSGVR